MKIIFKTTNTKVDIYFSYLRDILEKTCQGTLLILIMLIYIYYSDSNFSEYYIHF